MKFILIFLSLILITSCKKVESIKTKIISKTTIDSLSNEKDIKNFIVKIDTNFRAIKIIKPGEYIGNSTDNNCKSISDSLKIKNSFIKEDFDNNGYTDILITCSYYDFYAFIIYSFGNKKYEIKPLTKGHFQNCIFPKLNYINNLPTIELYSERNGFEDTLKKNKIDKKILSYRFGDLIEYNEAPKESKITKIEYSTTGCYGSCPIFELILNKDGNATYKAKHFNFSENFTEKDEGVFNARISPEVYNEITDLLNYIDFANLKKEYYVTWTDDQGCNLKITYDDGKVKIINDYGMIGTYGLSRLYEILKDLRTSQKWK